MGGIQGVLRRIHGSDGAAFDAVGAALPALTRAAQALSARLAAGGRWFNVGAGTSGRLGVLDAAELPPTFGVDPGLVVGLLAGGAEAMFRAVEGAEDDEAAGGRDLAAAGMTGRDAVVGLAASGQTPYVVGAIRHARAAGALTVAIVCTPRTPLLELAEIPVLLDTGPEMLEGSTRMKAGTAQKLALNMLSTAVMSARGLVVDGLMVAMRPTNSKLRARAVQIATRILGKTPAAAEGLLMASGWDLPAALVSGRWGLSPETARAHLASKAGSVAKALEEKPAPGR
jgi:N-acetylmuramic acid 6-phosphate etherase